MSLSIEDHRIIDEVERDHPGVPRYFCEVFYRFVKNNPEMAKAIERGEVNLPVLPRNEGMTDEEKLEAQKNYQEELKILFGNYNKTS